MGKPRPIKIRGPGGLKISLCGFRTKSQPYLDISSEDDAKYGFVENRDVKRLKSWCEACLKKRKVTRARAD